MVADVAFSNPFSLSRAAVVARLISDAPRDRTSDREALARVVAPRLQSVLREGAQAVGRLGDDDRRLVETALLYVTYHRYLPQIDAETGQLMAMELVAMRRRRLRLERASDVDSRWLCGVLNAEGRGLNTSFELQPGARLLMN